MTQTKLLTTPDKQQPYIYLDRFLIEKDVGWKKGQPLSSISEAYPQVARGHQVDQNLFTQFSSVEKAIIVSREELMKVNLVSPEIEAVREVVSGACSIRSYYFHRHSMSGASCNEQEGEYVTGWSILRSSCVSRI
jgi:hypothetical protein